MLNQREFQDRLQHLEALLREAESHPDARAQANVRGLVQAILDLHGTSLGRLLEHVAAAGEAGQTILKACAQDELVGGLLLLHGLHPLDLETRVRQALDRVRPYLRSHGGNVELLEINGGMVRLHMQGSCHSCPSSAQTLQGTIEEAIYASAPDVEAITVEGLELPAAKPAATFVPVEQLVLKSSAQPRRRNDDAEATARAGACAGHEQG